MKAGDQIEIHLAEPGCEHHHETCGKVMTENGLKRVDPSTICAVKLEDGR